MDQNIVNIDIKAIKLRKLLLSFNKFMYGRKRRVIDKNQMGVEGSINFITISSKPLNIKKLTTRFIIIVKSENKPPRYFPIKFLFIASMLLLL
ncbi:hypothetical protein HMPREF1982_02421 [Clostridiales bacterium oral taxon 876 str. F0540]|nr:hypothetical protein HMPREF1982_02421 [Clostridiales bacterium oral taxon 876 str. F0540]